MAPDHPLQPFSFNVLTRDTGTFAAKLQARISALASEREWVIAPPTLFECEILNDGKTHEPEAEDTRGNDDDDLEDQHPLGGYLDLYSAKKGTPLPYEVDRRHFEEVTALVRMLERFSIQHGLEIEFYLGRVFVGKITWGLQDRALREGLLEEWARMLAIKAGEGGFAGTEPTGTLLLNPPKDD